MSISPLAGKPAQPSILVDVPRLVTAYYSGSPDPRCPLSASRSELPGIADPRSSAFNEAHILAITQAIRLLPAGAEDRRSPLPRHRHTRALDAAFASALEVLAAKGVEVMIDPAAVTRRPRRIVRGCDDDAVGEPAFAPAVIGEDRVRDDRDSAASSTTRRTAARWIPSDPVDRGARQRLHPRQAGRNRQSAVRMRSSSFDDPPASVPRPLRQ